MKKVENRQHFTLYTYALISLIVTDIFVIIFLVVRILSKQKIYVIIAILLIMVYLITRAIVNCLKYYISKEECYCENENLIYKRILFKKFILKEMEIPLLNIQKVIDKGHIPSHNARRDVLNPLHYVVLFFNYYERILLEMKTGDKYEIFVYAFPYGTRAEELEKIYNDNDFLKSFDELKEMIEVEQKKILFSQKIENLSEKYNSPLDERYNYILKKILDEKKLFISEKDNNFVINGDSEAMKDLEIFKDMNFEEIDFYIFYVNYLSKKEYENKKVLVGYNGTDGKEVTMSKFKEDINELRDSRSIYRREVENE
ncbi:hypothetical protein CTM86_00640 [Fusobacterium pseudoperiodonticum]|uniref:Uncharacterized protein n=1 Tax=Fusobacterium pseudoperiodonticum TaxID=2663009 RepID=A0AAD0F318_9FUSO|nr:hypothetical protein [Fusobacterium pseudoperiodonticum]ATV65201.1 hypothetical protein CTM86_00640 [Fusobacterium pseudoperiodonticum]